MLDNLDFDQQSEYLYIDYQDYECEEVQESLLPSMGLSDILSSGLYYGALQLDNAANAARKYVVEPIEYAAYGAAGGLRAAGRVLKSPINKISNTWGGVKNVSSNFMDTHRSLNKILQNINTQAGKNFFSKLLNIDFDNVKRMLTMTGLSISQVMQIAKMAANIATQLEAYLSGLAETTQVLFFYSIEMMRLFSVIHLQKKMHQIRQVLDALKPSRINQNLQHTANIGFKIYDRIFNPKEYQQLEYLP